MKEFAIFDLDGTVIDSMWAWDNVGLDFLAKHDILPPDDLHDQLRTIGLKGAASLFIDRYNIDMTEDKIVEEFCSSVEHMYKNTIGLKQDISDFLKYLKKNNVKMCIATACNFELAEIVLKRLGILHYFEFILTCDELNTNKHLPLIYQVAAQRLGGNTENTVVYEDSLHTVITAKRAVFEVIAIHDDWENGNHQLIAQNADRFIMTYGELLA